MEERDLRLVERSVVVDDASLLRSVCGDPAEKVSSCCNGTSSVLERLRRRLDRLASLSRSRSRSFLLSCDAAAAAEADEDEMVLSSQTTSCTSRMIESRATSTCAPSESAILGEEEGVAAIRLGPAYRDLCFLVLTKSIVDLSGEFSGLMSNRLVFFGECLMMGGTTTEAGEAGSKAVDPRPLTIR